MADWEFGAAGWAVEQRRPGYLRTHLPKGERARIVEECCRPGASLAVVARRHWDGLRVFLADGRVEMDTNAVENRIRPLALTRKNALFAGHDEGAVAWSRMATLIETAKMNGVEPYAYLKATLEAIAAGHPAARIDELLPWAYTPAGQ